MLNSWGWKFESSLSVEEARMRTIEMSRTLRIAVVSLALVTGAGFVGNTYPVAAQKSSPERNADPIMPPPSQPGGLTSEDPSVAGRVGQDRVDAMRMADRRNHAQKDLERMAALTSELQADFAKTNQGQLSADFAKKAKEVEKLAHDLQTQISH